MKTVANRHVSIPERRTSGVPGQKPGSRGMAGMPLMELSAEDRHFLGKLGAHSRWAAESDRSAATLRARQAFDKRFERQVDPDGKLTPEERAKRAANARSAYFTRLVWLRVRKQKAANKKREAAKTSRAGASSDEAAADVQPEPYTI